MSRLRLREGVALRPVPFGGAFVVDRERLAAVEIDDELAGWLTYPTITPPPELRERLARGLADGWLVADPSQGG